MRWFRRPIELSALDRAIGDGDHGSNMTRAAQKVAAMADELDALPAGEALCRAGKAVVMSTGGASGPLYGSLLLDMGKNLPDAPGLADWGTAFLAGVAAVARRGRSAWGDKTMIDVLEPAAKAFEAAADDGLGTALAAMVEGARHGFELSRPLRARRGRAAYVGDRSIGNDDPGAASALLCIETIAAFLGDHLS